MTRALSACRLLCGARESSRSNGATRDSCAFPFHPGGDSVDTTPVSLLERLRQPGEGQAWQRFTELYTPLMYYWARRLGMQPPDAADLVQEVFAILIQKLPEFAYDRRNSFRNWLRTVMFNKWRDQQRRADPPQQADEATLAELAGPDHVDWVGEEEYRQNLIRRALQIMQADFQPATWKACWEYVVSDRPAAEVAAELGISVGAVYVAKSRVLSRLRQELEGLLD
jgi:RNA polymerase sigma-70 factor (ECF subfamily)